MLPKKKRVTTELFKDLLKRGRIASTDFFTVRYFEEAKPSPSRIAVVVSKKVSIRAVDRNLVKRRISSIVRKLYPDLKDSFIVGIFPKRNVLQAPFSKISNELDLLLRKTPIFRR